MKAIAKAGIFSLMALCATLSTACTVSVGTSKDNVTKDIETSTDFTRISSLGAVDVEVVKGAPFVRVSASDQRLIDAVKTEVKDGTLYIWQDDLKSSNIININNNVKVTVSVSAMPFNVTIEGSGDLVIDGAGLDTGREIGFELTGSGDMKLSNIKSASLEISSMGSGDVSASNIDAGSVSINSSGSGDFEMSNVKFAVMLLSSKGSGDIDLRNLQGGSIRGRSGGSGDITITGTCDKRDLVTDGSGDVNVSNLKVINQ